MSRSTNNIDKLFEMARNSEPIVSNNELSELIKAKPSSTKTEIIKTKGIKPMNILYGTVAAVAASGIMFWSGIFDSEETKPTVLPIMAENKPTITNENNAPAKETLIAENKDSKLSEKSYSDKKIVTVSNEKKNISINSKQLDVKGINIISMKKADLEKMGFRFGKDNSMSFVAFHESPHPMNITIAKDKQFFVFPAEKDQNGTALQPRFITDPMGNRHLSLFSGDNMQFLEANYTSENNEDMDKIIRKIQEENVVWVSEDKAKETIDGKIKRDVDIADDKVLVHKIYLTEKEISDLKNRIDISQDKSYVGNAIENNTPVWLAMNNLNVDSLNKEALNNRDNLDEEVKNNLIHYSEIYQGIPDSDSVKKYNFKIVKKIFDGEFKESQLSDFYKNTPSSDTISHKKVIIVAKDIEIDEKDTKNYNIDFMYNTNDSVQTQVKLLIKSDGKDFNSDMKRFPLNPDGTMTEKFGKNLLDEVRINKLVPIAVSLDDTETDYIFWFDPTSEFVRALPEEVQLKLEPEILAMKDNKYCNNEAITGEDTYFDVWRTCNGAIENLNVYPNPAAENINVSYSLNDTRDVSIYLHDMNGKEIKILKPSVAMSNSGHLLKFNIEDIPAGMYLVSVQTNTGEKAVQRIIIE